MFPVAVFSSEQVLFLSGDIQRWLLGVSQVRKRGDQGRSDGEADVPPNSPTLLQPAGICVGAARGLVLGSLLASNPIHTSGCFREALD